MRYTALTRKAIELAKSGDGQALRLCISRVIAPRRSRPVTVDLPNIESLADIVAALDAVLRAGANGQLTPDEAEQFTNLLGEMRQAMETVELAADIAALKESEAWADVN